MTSFKKGGYSVLAKTFNENTLKHFRKHCVFICFISVLLCTAFSAGANDRNQGTVKERLDAFEKSAEINIWPRLNGCQYAESFKGKVAGVIIGIHNNGKATGRWDGRCHVPITHELVGLKPNVVPGIYIVAVTSTDNNLENRILQVIDVLGPPNDQKILRAALERICTRGDVGKYDDRDCEHPAEIGRDGSFIAYDNGTVLDTNTNLMWSAKDNGTHINWQAAKSYCENFRGGSYTDWRMPTQDELAGLYDSGKSYRAVQSDSHVHLTELIKLSACCPWSSDNNGTVSSRFDFTDGKRLLAHQARGWIRALPVRSVK